MLVVASSRSFGAVNREQFYVSISRGRKRVQVFTDDAELLARRVTDSHERKAAVELQALRDDLAKLGFLRRPQPEQHTVAPVRQDFRTMRQTPRVFRATRLSPVQPLAQVVEDVHRWLRERSGVEQKEVLPEKLPQTESIKQPEAVTPTQKIKRSRTVKEALQEKSAARRKLGWGITPTGDTGHSRGIGV